MPNLNQCVFMGHLARDPEMRMSQSGNAVTNLTIAVGDSEKQNGEWVKTTEWVNAVCFGKTAEYVAKEGRKGNLCLVSGKMKTRKWEDKAGVTKYTTEIIADSVQPYAGPKDKADNYSAPKKGQAVVQDDFDDSIPF